MRVSGPDPFEGCPLLELEIGQKMLRLRNDYLQRLIEVERGVQKSGIPLDILFATFRLAGMPAKKTKLLEQEMASKSSALAEYLVLLRRIVRLEQFLLTGLTEEQQRDRVERIVKLFRSFPPEFVSFLYQSLTKRPRGAPSKRKYVTFAALQHKIDNPSTTWGELAIAFRKSTAHTNTLHASILSLRKELRELGIVKM